MISAKLTHCQPLETFIMENIIPTTARLIANKFSTITNQCIIYNINNKQVYAI